MRVPFDDRSPKITVPGWIVSVAGGLTFTNPRKRYRLVFESVMLELILPSNVLSPCASV
jgi:hypothetical protein